MTPSDLPAALRDARDTRCIRIADGAIEGFGSLFAEVFPGGQIAGQAVVVSDIATWAVAGRRVVASLRAAGVPTHTSLVFPASPRLQASWQRVDEVEHVLISNHALPVAVGSGTLAELAKAAAHRRGKRCIVVATAASSTAYTAPGAVILRDGAYQDVECPAPKLVVADPAVVAAAPAELAAHGALELAVQATTAADWLLADAIGLDPVVPRAHELAQPAPGGDQLAGLLACGLAAQVAGSSRPLLGAARLLARALSEDGLDATAALALAERVVSGLYRQLLEEGPHLDIAARCAAWPTWVEIEAGLEGIPEPRRSAVRDGLRAKHILADALAARLRLLAERWSAVKSRLAVQLAPVQLAPVRAQRPAALAMPRAALAAAVARARILGRAYTILDLVVELGTADAWLARIRP